MALSMCRLASSGRLMSALPHLKSRSTSLIQPFAPLASAAKTPVQRWGWEYLQRQEKSKRPLSPHLSIYEPQLQMIVSGLHRITGSVLGGAIAVASIGMMVAPFDFPEVIEWIRHLDIPHGAIVAFKYAISLPLVFHAINGVRFLGYDLAKGIEITTFRKTGWTVIVLSFIGAAIVTFWTK